MKNGQFKPKTVVREPDYHHSLSQYVKKVMHFNFLSRNVLSCISNTQLTFRSYFSHFLLDK